MYVAIAIEGVHLRHRVVATVAIICGGTYVLTPHASTGSTNSIPFLFR